MKGVASIEGTCQESVEESVEGTPRGREGDVREAEEGRWNPWKMSRGRSEWHGGRGNGAREI